MFLKKFFIFSQTFSPRTDKTPMMNVPNANIKKPTSLKKFLIFSFIDK